MVLRRLYQIDQKIVLEKKNYEERRGVIYPIKIIQLRNFSFRRDSKKNYLIT